MRRLGMGEIGTDVYGVTAEKFELAGFEWTAAQLVANDADGIIDGGECSADEAVELEPDEDAAMPCARNVTAKPGGTTASIGAVSVTVYGKDIGGNDISEELPAFTASSTTAVSGDKAFKEITKVVVPAMEGAGATVDIGWGNKLGIPMKLESNLVVAAVYNGARESTAPTVATDTEDLAKNTIAFHTSLGGKAGEVYIIV